MKTRYATYAAALLALALLLTSCASTADKSDNPVKAESLSETVYRAESLFETVPAATLAASETDTLQAEPAETGVRVSAHWSDAARTAYRNPTNSCERDLTFIKKVVGCF